MLGDLRSIFHRETFTLHRWPQHLNTGHLVSNFVTSWLSRSIVPSRPRTCSFVALSVRSTLLLRIALLVHWIYLLIRIFAHLRCIRLLAEGRTSHLLKLIIIIFVRIS